MSVAEAHAVVGGMVSEKRSNQYNLLKRYEIEVYEGRWPGTDGNFLKLVFHRNGTLFQIFDNQEIYGDVNLKKLFERYSKKFGTPTRQINKNFNISNDSKISVRWNDTSCTQYCQIMTLSVGKSNYKDEGVKTTIDVMIIDVIVGRNNEEDFERALQELKESLENQVKM